MTTLVLGAAEFDAKSGRLLRDGKAVRLSDLERRFLRYLAARIDTPIPREQILADVWEYNPSVHSRAIDAAVVRLRRKIEHDPANPTALRSAYGRGYRLTATPTSGGPTERVSEPAAVVSLIGRSADLERMRPLLRAAGVTTLLGPPGVGKTSLAAQLLAELGSTVPTVLVDLTEADDGAALVACVASALGARVDAAVSSQWIGDEIRRRGRVCVLLDNFEQLVAEAGEVGRWASLAPDATFVVTTRVRLGLSAERVVEVEPLLPADAALLFIERARQATPSFVVDAVETRAIHELVTLLDGLPLAVELAAGRTRALAPTGILARITDRFRLLVCQGGKPQRHVAFRAALDSSWELLAPWEASALAQLSVFVGGFRLDAAEAVLDLSEFDAVPWALDVVQHLVDASLVRRHTSGRFDLLLSVREYATEKLGGAKSATEERHGRYYAALGRAEALDALDRHGGVERRRALMAELENLVVATRRAVARGDGDVAARSVRAAWAVFEIRGSCARAAELAIEVLRMDTLAVRERASVALVCAQASRGVGSVAEALVHCDTALAAARACGDRCCEGDVLVRLGEMHRRRGAYEAARRSFDEALTVHREAGNFVHEARVLGDLGLLDLDEGRLDDARGLLEGALAMHRQVGNLRGEGFALSFLGTVHQAQGRSDEAQRSLEAGLAVHREAGDRLREGTLLANLGDLHLSLGHVNEARALFSKALAVHREVGNQPGEGSALVNEAVVHREEGRLDEARAALESAHAIARSLAAALVLAQVLAERANLEYACGNAEVARRSLSEAESRARELGVGPESNIGRNIAAARARLEAAPTGMALTPRE